MCVHMMKKSTADAVIVLLYPLASMHNEVVML